MGDLVSINLKSVKRQLRADGEPPDNGEMQARIAKLESLAEKTSERLGAIEKDVSIIKSNYATREDLQAAKADLHKAMNDQTWKIITWMTGISTALVAATFFLARFVK